MATKKQILEKAVEKLEQVIEMVSVATEGDANAKVYMVDQLKVLCSDAYGFVSGGLKLDELADKADEKDIGYDEFLEDEEY